ncbi:MAG: hypothetical protein HC936_07955 [Leptolyngbyaceae cyanobacterium SU_3_3]|nr:hypothetical protein [Leptolyngbyaceae cyanobacterium SU_3_3]
MTLVDCQPASINPVTELVSRSLSSLNQQTYLRLRLALSLNLRRQILWLFAMMWICAIALQLSCA